MNKIQTKQNESKFIDYLKAQRIAYRSCKRYQHLDSISILLAISLPIIGVLCKDLEIPIGIFLAFWTLLYLYIDQIRKQKAIQGATIQEQFDTELFEIPWNKKLSKSKISLDIQVDLASKYKKDDLLNWYSTEIDENLPKPQAILLCQRENSLWSLKQKKDFIKLLKSILTMYYSTILVYFLVTNPDFYSQLIFLAPSLTFFIYGIKNIKSLNQRIYKKIQIISKIDGALKSLSKNNIEPSGTELRDIQDLIFIGRKIPEKIPDWFYYFNKSNNEERADNIIKKCKEDF